MKSGLTNWKDVIELINYQIKQNDATSLPGCNTNGMAYNAVVALLKKDDLTDDEKFDIISGWNIHGLSVKVSGLPETLAFVKGISFEQSKDRVDKMRYTGAVLNNLKSYKDGSLFERVRLVASSI